MPIVVEEIILLGRSTIIISDSPEATRGGNWVELHLSRPHFARLLSDPRPDVGRRLGRWTRDGRRSRRQIPPSRRRNARQEPSSQIGDCLVWPRTLVCVSCAKGIARITTLARTDFPIPIFLSTDRLIKSPCHSVITFLGGV